MDMLFYVGLAVGMLLGAKIPDIDQLFLSVIGHRSIVTHSPLIPLLLNHYLKPDTGWKRGVVGGVSLAMVMHFSFDLFPQSWVSLALIQVKLFVQLFRFDATLSVLWLFAAVVVCAFVGLQSLRDRAELIAALVMMGIGYAIMQRTETAHVLPLVVSVLALLLASLVDNPVLPGKRLVRRLMRQP